MSSSSTQQNLSFGNYPIMQSKEKHEDIKFINIQDIGAELDGKEVFFLDFFYLIF